MILATKFAQSWYQISWELLNSSWIQSKLWIRVELSCVTSQGSSPSTSKCKKKSYKISLDIKIREKTLIEKISLHKLWVQRGNGKNLHPKSQIFKAKANSLIRNWCIGDLKSQFWRLSSIQLLSLFVPPYQIMSPYRWSMLNQINSMGNIR